MKDDFASVWLTTTQIHLLVWPQNVAYGD